MYDRAVREPPITITCDCDTAALVPYGDTWQCPDCGKAWNTTQIPRAEFDALLSGVKRYRLVVLGPPMAIAAVLVPLAVLVGLQYAFLLFVLVMAHGLLVVPQIRKRTSAAAGARAASWKLSPE